VCASQQRCRTMPPPPAAASNLSWRRADGEPPILTLDTPARCSTSTIIVRVSGGCHTVGAPRARALECNLRAFDVCARAALFSFRSSRFARPLARERRRDGYIRAVGGRRRRFLPSSFRVTRHPSPSLSVSPLLSQLFMDFFFLGDVARNFNTAAVFEDGGSAQLIYDRARVAKM
jgi:hypothetical protein